MKGLRGSVFLVRCCIAAFSESSGIEIASVGRLQAIARFFSFAPVFRFGEPGTRTNLNSTFRPKAAAIFPRLAVFYLSGK